jgi:hypothetical protein
MSEADRFLHKLLSQYYKYIQLSGAYDKHATYPRPSLTNAVLPMFSRWVTGPGQHTSQIYPRIKPALQLASRLLTEDFPLTWWTHLTYGERRADSAGTYIADNPYSRTPEAIAQVKRKILKAGKVITFMFEPEGYETDRAHGSTTAYKHHRDFFEEIRQRDWPPVDTSDDGGHARPCVVINSKTQEFFLHRYSSASQDEIYRALCMFTITLVHEFAHAYNWWLTPGTSSNEPRWCKDEKEAELGWSWEQHVIGYGVDMDRRPGDARDRFRSLFQMRVLEYHSATEHGKVLSTFKGTNRTDDRFTMCDASGRKSRPAVLKGGQFRHSETWFQDTNTATHFVAAITTIPMSWTTAWFQEQEWSYRKQYWASKGFYVRPSLGTVFVVLYDRCGNDAITLRPLNPAIPADKEILERRARGLPDYSR